MNILRGKAGDGYVVIPVGRLLTLFSASIAARRYEGRPRLFFHFIQSNSGFQHEQHVKALLTDILDYARNVLRFGDGLVYGLSQFLDQASQTLIQIPTSFPPAISR